jgi:hypothetical protein
VLEGDWHEWVSDELNVVVWALRMSDDSHDSLSAFWVGGGTLAFWIHLSVWRTTRKPV